MVKVSDENMHTFIVSNVPLKNVLTVVFKLTKINKAVQIKLKMILIIAKSQTTF